jgi:uncharacterized protein (UPF0276 family)
MSPLIKGFGLGLRPEHYLDILNGSKRVEWLEILTDNYLVPGGKPLYYLDLIRQEYPMVMHGVAMNLGSVTTLDRSYLKSVKALADRIEPQIISDHLCWTGFDHNYLHDLLPLPYSEESIEHVSSRIRQVQDLLERRIAIENLSAYLEPKSPLSEWEFIVAVAESADCDILLDINNIYVSSRNQNFDPLEYLQSMPVERVRQFHLAGHTDLGQVCIDTHDHPICEAVWALYKDAVSRFGDVPTMIERDDNIPDLDVLLLELDRARSIQQSVLATKTDRNRTFYEDIKEAI